MSSHLFGFSSTLSALFFTFSSFRPCGAGVAACSNASLPSAPAATAAVAAAVVPRNSRRFRYSFLSVISELRMSAARLISMVSLWTPENRRRLRER
jgi:hypothetical protein